MRLKLSKTAIKELKARFRAVLIASLAGFVVLSTQASAATITIPDGTDGNVTGSSTGETTIDFDTLATKTELTDGLAEKQANLTAEQLTAVNSGVSAETVAKVATNADAIANNTTKINANTANIESNTAVISFIAEVISTNTVDIAKNAENIATNANAIATNTTNISNNSTAISANTANIATNTADIEKNETNIATNAQNIAANTANIETNKTAIATNAADIAEVEANLNNTITQTTTALNNLVSETNGTITFRTADGIDETTAYTATQTDTNIATAIDNLVKADTTYTGNNTFTGGTTFGSLSKTSIANDGAITAGNGLDVTGSATFNDGLTIGTTGNGFDASGNLTVGTITGTTITGEDILGTSLSAGTGSITGGSLVLNGTTVTGVDTGSNLTDATGTTTLATNATVYNTVIGQAENGTYSGETIKTAGTAPTTIKEAVSTTTAALNNVLNEAGEVDSAKVDVQWNSQDSTLQTALGSGALNEGNKNLTAGADVTTSLNALDATIGNVKDLTGSNLDQESDKTVQGHLTALDTAIGDRTNLNSANEAINTESATSVASGLKAAGDAIGTTTFATANGNISDTTKDLTTAINELDTAIGDKNFTASSLNYTPATQGATLTEAIQTINANIGTAVTGANGNVMANNSINQNLDSLDQSIGNRQYSVTTSTNYDPSTWTDTTVTGAINQVSGNIGAQTATNYNGVLATNTVNANIDAINATIGDMSQMQNRNNNLAQGSSVVANLDSLDQAIGNRAYTSTNYISSGSDLSSAVSSLDSNLSRVEDEMNKMDHEMRSGFASLAALSALVPNARSAGDTQLSLGTGYYRGTTGFAVGAFHHLNDNVLLNAGAAYAGNGSATFRSGVTFGF